MSTSAFRTEGFAVRKQDLELVDAAEGERVTGLDRSTLYRLARTGRVRSYKVLTALRFNRADLLALVEERPVVAQNTHDGDS